MLRGVLLISAFQIRFPVLFPSSVSVLLIFVEFDESPATID